MLQALPAVGRVLAEPSIEALSAEHGRDAVKSVVRNLVEEQRAAIRAGSAPRPIEAAAVRERLIAGARPQLRRAINGTGVILHTNLGRAPLADAAIEAMQSVALGYSNLEYSLSDNERGDRHRHVRGLLSALLGAEDALVFNNCAGALLVTLAALAAGREVICSRGELIEIGGGFRIPDVMRQSGARLVEVGTTNKTHETDYAQALGDETGAILQVHRSNFSMDGFVAAPTVEALATIAARKARPLVVDQGSGLIASDRDLGEMAPAFRNEPRPGALLGAGADVVLFSGDKLLGGPQAGLVVGGKIWLDRIRTHPLARALRADKLQLAALEATLSLYRSGQSEKIPTIKMIATPPSEVAQHAQAIADALHTNGIAATVRPSEATTGGGTLPKLSIPSHAVVLPPHGTPEHLRSRLAAAPTPIIGRALYDRIALDARTMQGEDQERICASVVHALSGTQREEERDERTG